MKNSYVMLLSGLMILLTLSRSDSRETKPSYAATFCGDAFIEAWGKVCEYKRLQYGRKRKSIEGKRNIIKVISRQAANTFLHTLIRKKRYSHDDAADNASEECCKETCTIREIAEYDC